MDTDSHDFNFNLVINRYYKISEFICSINFMNIIIYRMFFFQLYALNNTYLVHLFQGTVSAKMQL